MHVVVLGPMPMEVEAIVTAFGLERQEGAGAGGGDIWTGRLGGARVTAVHTGMGPPLTRAALERLFDRSSPAHDPIDHVMTAGICGGISFDLPVGTLLNPEVVIDHSTGVAYRHRPPAAPGAPPLAGKLVTTETATLAPDLTERFRRDGCVGVDMETAAVAEVCEAHRCPWSAYRCIGDRLWDGLLDQRVLAVTNPDGSGNLNELSRLLAAEPDLGGKLAQLGRDTSRAAKLAAEAAARACVALAAEPSRENGAAGRPLEGQ